MNLQVNFLFKQPLGQVLKQAGLISNSQLDVALKDQSLDRQILIGEILALRGCIKRETVEFFANCLPNSISKETKKPLGYYLKQAGLLSETQIKYLLSLQKQGQSWIRFGRLAVIHNLLKQETLDFFLGNICSKNCLDRVYLSDE